jgi:hypothetical protein
MDITRNGGKWKLLLFLLILGGVFLVARLVADSTQGKEEIIATFDNGIGGVDTMTRKGKALTLKVSSKSAKIESIEWKDKSAFDYNATKKLEDGQAFISLEKSFRIRLAAAYQTQQSLYSAGAGHYPLAGESTKSSIKYLKINGQSVDEVKEYVDADGHTWYFKNLKLREDENVVSFD